MRADALVAVFARSPVAGRVKTRLIPALGAWRAAQLHRRLLGRALRIARAANCGEVVLHGTSRHSLFRAPTFRGASFRLQRGADLGERMHRAIQEGLRRHRGVIVIGADCPALRAADLRRAARLLSGGYDAVIAPAEDGGYALIGMRRPGAAVFQGIVWGSPEVYRATLERLAGHGYRWRALRTLWDVDLPADLPRLQSLRNLTR